jgi:N-acetylmuramoyl-L-alanine amidase
MRLRIILSLAAAGALAVPAYASADFAHVVSAGETLSSVAAADGLTVDQVAAANGLSPDAQLIAGSTLSIPPQNGSGTAASGSPTGTSVSAPVAPGTTGDGDGDGDDQGGTGTAPSASPTATATATGGYVVQPGDTLSAIAARAGITVADLAAANGLDPNGVLLSGSVLQFSGSQSSAASAVSSQPIGPAAQGAPGAPPYPTPEALSASQVGSIASANGAPASLAEAIGWQESGFNNNLVSSAGAVGVMQITPGTWDWIQRSLTPGSPLSPSSAADNVRGGALMLNSLLNATGGDSALATAGYYQGLASVQQNGMYADTQQYVNNVMALRQQFGWP